MSSRKAGSGKSGKTAQQNGTEMGPGGPQEDQCQVAASADGLTEAGVLAFLGAHPDFFRRHPEALVQLQISHGPDGAVSLIEHQVKVLRRQLETERARLTQLIDRARDYESVASRLHALVLQLIPTTDMQGLCDVLQDALRREFGATAVTLRLFALETPQGAAADPLAIAFQGFLEREHALCGPLEADKIGILFGDLGEEVRSAALVPIRADGSGGVLAIGAAEAVRFRPEMGTDLLDRLGEVVARKLCTLATGSATKGSRKGQSRTSAKPAQTPGTGSNRRSAPKTGAGAATAPASADPAAIPVTNAGPIPD